jgi:hypothetical protein
MKKSKTIQNDAERYILGLIRAGVEVTIKVAGARTHVELKHQGIVARTEYPSEIDDNLLFALHCTYEDLVAYKIEHGTDRPMTWRDHALYRARKDQNRT